MKLLILIFFMISSISVTAQVVATPPGWVEMVTPEPIILSWAKVVAGQKLENSPTIMIQKHEHSQKWKSALKSISLQSDGCKEVLAVTTSDWNQSYCEKEKAIYVFLWRGNKEEVLPALEDARKWLKANE